MSTVYSPRTTKRYRRTKDDIQRIRGAICEALALDHPMTVRQVFYRLVSKAVIDKTEAEYKQTVVRLLLKMRREGLVPYDWVSDNTRWMRKPRTWSSMESMLQHTSQTYRRSLWDNQDVYVEVWCEKDALAGVILEETQPWDVPLMVSRGFASESYLYECAQQIIAAERPAYLYYFGDHDPSGVRIDKSIQRNLERLAPDCEIHFERVAVLPEQITTLDLPTRPTKTEGTHARGFEGDSVELDAIPVGTLREMVRDRIEAHVDQNAYRVAGIKRAAELLDHLPDEGESLHCVLLGYFDLMNVLLAFLDKISTPCEVLRVATLSASKRNVSELAGLLDAGAVRRLDLLTSEFQREHDPDIFAEAVADLSVKRGQRVAAARSHAKVITLAVADGRRYVFHGSANLRTSRNAEQVTLCRSADVYEFYDTWLSEIVEAHEVRQSDDQTQG